MSTKDYFLRVWREAFPESYTRTIDEDPRSSSIVGGFAEMWERVSAAFRESAQAFFLKDHSIQTAPPASGEVRATGFISVERSHGAPLFPVTFAEGQLVALRLRTQTGTSVDGPVFRVTADTTLGPADLGPLQVPVEAVRPGWQGNVPEGRMAVFVEGGRATIPNATVTGPNAVTAGSGIPDHFLESMVGALLQPTTGPDAGVYPRRILTVGGAIPVTTATFDGPGLTPAGLVNFEVLELVDAGVTATFESTSGGRHGELDMLGRERGLGRASGEADDAFRERICELPDTVSPAALERTLAEVLDPEGVTWALLEMRDVTLPGGVYDDLTAYDDPLAMSRGQVYCGAFTDPFYNTGFFVLIDGTTWPVDPADQQTVYEAIYKSITLTKGAGVRWAIGFEPPIP